MGRSSFHLHLSAKQELSSAIARNDGRGRGRGRPCPAHLSAAPSSTGHDAILILSDRIGRHTGQAAWPLNAELLEG